MKRVRKAAIVESSDSGESDGSDYEESLMDKIKRKKDEGEGVMKEKAKAKSKTRVSEIQDDQSPAKKVKLEAKKEPVVKKSKPAKKEADESTPAKKIKLESKVKEPVKKKTPVKKKAAGLEVSGAGNVAGGGGGDSSWSPAGVVARELGLERGVSEATCSLLQAGNSLPFIARYRREATGGMGPDVLRQVSSLLTSLVAVREKCGKLLGSLDKAGKLTPVLRVSLQRCESLGELEHVHAPYKTGSKASLAERAKSLGLEEAAVEVLEWGARAAWRLPGLVQPGVQGRDSLQEVQLGLQHIMADIMVHDEAMVDLVRSLQNTANIGVEAKKAKVVKSKEKEMKEKPPVDFSKFENYFEFSCPAKYLKPHQTLALNRGESLKALSVKVVVPDWFLGQLQALVGRRWLHRPYNCPPREELVKASLEDAYKRMIVPLVQRQTRAALTRAAEEASITVFLENLRSLLLAPPCRSLASSLLVIDPGFRHGCKVAVLGERGELIDHTVIHPRAGESPDAPASRQLVSLVARHNVTRVAIGNGTACREVEGLVSGLIARGVFGHRKVQYTIVSEQGASIYSCSELAQKEFPGLDTNIVSAVSIGRRLQDPLSELVKISPEHLGVGMYQHDLPKLKLKQGLDEVVVECVSFVGVELNSCSSHLLQRVAGLNSARAAAIVAWREEKGAFTSRDQLRKVKGVGDRVFQQCAGFLRLREPKDPLDSTQIHPESYTAARRLVEMAGCSLDSLGSREFRERVGRLGGREGLARELGVGGPTLELLVASLQQSRDYDLRAEFAAPLFKSGMTRMEDVKIGETLTGKVGNVTHFGAFVDVGLGKDGLVHSSKMRGNKLELGQRVEVKVLTIEMARGKLGLDLVRVL